jgi:hypothetical protein
MTASKEIAQNNTPARNLVWHNEAMHGRSSKPDFAQNALRVFEQTIAEELAKPAPKKKNPAAVALGKLGGLKGGKVRAMNLTAEERRAIASKAARARWEKEKAE